MFGPVDGPAFSKQQRADALFARGSRRLAWLSLVLSVVALVLSGTRLWWLS